MSFLLGIISTDFSNLSCEKIELVIMPPCRITEPVIIIISKEVNLKFFKKVLCCNSFNNPPKINTGAETINIDSLINARELKPKSKITQVEIAFSLTE